MFPLELRRLFSFLLYRWRFLLIYIAIGFSSLVFEVIFFRGFQKLGLQELPANLLALGSGIFFAYWLNVRFNFRVPRAKRNRAIFYFVIISLLSGLTNYSLRNYLYRWHWSYESSRFAISGVLFIFAYYLHRRFSFRDRKQVGVAIYANGVEDLQSIWNKIDVFPDFIHVDLIDETFGEMKHSPAYYRLETIRWIWRRKEIHLHLMTRKPSVWLPEVFTFVDLIYIHFEIDEPLEDLIQLIRASGKKVGLCIRTETPAIVAKPWVHSIDSLMLLTIKVPGHSGQHLELENTLEKIREINAWPERSGFSLSVDGGVNEQNIGLLSIEWVVSGSSVLLHPHPKQQVLRLQTSGSYDP
jgi:pentose-5-phosphate-3-epimerase